MELFSKQRFSVEAIFGVEADTEMARILSQYIASLIPCKLQNTMVRLSLGIPKLVFDYRWFPGSIEVSVVRCDVRCDVRHAFYDLRGVKYYYNFETQDLKHDEVAVSNSEKEAPMERCGIGRIGRIGRRREGEPSHRIRIDDTIDISDTVETPHSVCPVCHSVSARSP